MSISTWTSSSNLESYLDFSTAAELVRAVVESERLVAGHLFNSFSRLRPYAADEASEARYNALWRATAQIIPVS